MFPYISICFLSTNTTLLLKIKHLGKKIKKVRIAIDEFISSNMKLCSNSGKFRRNVVHSVYWSSFLLYPEQSHAMQLYYYPILQADMCCPWKKIIILSHYGRSSPQQLFKTACSSHTTCVSLQRMGDLSRCKITSGNQMAKLLLNNCHG